MTDELPNYKVGQIWADKKRKPTMVFMITKLWDKEYEGGNKALRVTGFQSAAPTCWWEELDAGERDLDARSVMKLFISSLGARPA